MHEIQLEIRRELHEDSRHTTGTLNLKKWRIGTLRHTEYYRKLSIKSLIICSYIMIIVVFESG